MSTFVIRRPSAKEPRSLIVPEAMVKGLGVMHKSGYATKADQAAGGEFYGFLTQNVTATGNADQLKQEAWLPGTILDWDAKINDAVTIVDADEFEAEGSDLCVASPATGHLDADTAIGTRISFSGGKLYEAQPAAITVTEDPSDHTPPTSAAITTPGDQVYFILVENMTPETEGNFRGRFVRV